MYPPNQPLAEDRWPPRGMPPQGWTRNGEITGEADTRPFVLHNDTVFPGMLEDAIHAPLRRAYYSAVSWVDSQIGLALDALDASGLANTTWITFIGDHGWALGEHGNWAKQALFENALRVPLIIAPPRGAPGWRRGATVGAPAMVEALDLFPTVAELLGMDAPPGQLEGRSLVPFLRDAPPPKNFTPYAFSQIVREDRPGCKGPGPAEGFPIHPWDTDPPSGPHATGTADQCLMGLSVRTNGFRCVFCSAVRAAKRPPAGRPRSPPPSPFADTRRGLTTPNGTRARTGRCGTPLWVRSCMTTAQQTPRVGRAVTPA